MEDDAWPKINSDLNVLISLGNDYDSISKQEHDVIKSPEKV